MGDDQRKPGSDVFIVDNSDADWKVRNYLTEWCGLAKPFLNWVGKAERLRFDVPTAASARRKRVATL